MNRAAVQKAVAESRLPVKIKEYLSVFAAGGADSDLRRLLKADPQRLLADISLLIGRAAETLGVPREEALFATGFDPRNFAPGRLEAALAELRAAEFLAGEGARQDRRPHGKKGRQDLRFRGALRYRGRLLGRFIRSRWPP